MNIPNENIFFVKDNNNDIDNKFNKEKLNSYENIYRNSSISTEATFENDFSSQGEEIDFHQDFFPKYPEFKFTDSLVDNWREKIHIFYNNLFQYLSKLKNLKQE